MVVKSDVLYRECASGQRMVRKPYPFPSRKFPGRKRLRRATIGFTPRVLDPFRFLLITLAGCMNQRQLQMIDYLREENRVLREQLGGRRLRLNDDQRRRLAARAKFSQCPNFGRILSIPLVRPCEMASHGFNGLAGIHLAFRRNIGD